MVEVGKDRTVGNAAFLSWSNPNKNPVEMLAVSTGSDTDGRWEFSEIPGESALNSV